MMQARDWIIGLIGVVIAALGVLSLMEYLPFELQRAALLWVSAIAAVILLYASIIEITNSNIMGTVSLIVGLVAIAASLFPIAGWLELKFLGDIFYKIVLVVEGAFLMIATFAMEL